MSHHWFWLKVQMETQLFHVCSIYRPLFFPWWHFSLNLCTQPPFQFLPLSFLLFFVLSLIFKIKFKFWLLFFGSLSLFLLFSICTICTIQFQICTWPLFLYPVFFLLEVRSVHGIVSSKPQNLGSSFVLIFVLLLFWGFHKYFPTIYQKQVSTGVHVFSHVCACVCVYICTRTCACMWSSGQTCVQTVCTGWEFPNPLWYHQAHVYTWKDSVKVMQTGLALWVVQLLSGWFGARQGDFQPLQKPFN